MTVDFNLPDLGEGIEEADVVAVLVREGDTVSVEQAVITIETEKATVDVPSSVAGTVSKVHVALRRNREARPATDHRRSGGHAGRSGASSRVCPAGGGAASRDPAGGSRTHRGARRRYDGGTAAG